MNDQFLNLSRDEAAWHFGQNSCQPLDLRDGLNKARNRGKIWKNNRPAMLEYFNTGTNTIPAGLQRHAILQEIVSDFARRLLPLKVFSNTFRDVPLQGSNKVEVVYLGLDSGGSSSWNPATGYAPGDTTTDVREIEIGTAASSGQGDRKFQGLAFTSEEISRQPFLKTAELAKLKADKLASDIIADILSIITLANYGAAALTVAAAAFSPDDIADLKLACKLWPVGQRALCIDSDYDCTLLKDSAIKSAMAFGGAEAIRGGKIPNVFGFDYYELPTIPDNSENLKGFAVHPAAALVAFAPVAPTAEVIAAGTRWEQVIDPVTGIGFEYRTFGNPTLDRGEHYIEASYGYAKGNANALKRITT